MNRHPPRSEGARRTNLRLLLFYAAVPAALGISVAAGGVDLSTWIRTGSMRPPSRLERIDAMRTAFTEERWSDALAQARALADVLPDDPETMRIEATSLVRTGRPGDAVPVLMRIVDKDPADTTSRLALGQSLLDAGRVPEARTVLAAVHRNPLAGRELRMAAMGLLVKADAMDPPPPPSASAGSAKDAPAR